MDRWVALLDELQADPRVEPSQMMGYQCAKVGGKIFVSYGDDAFIFKLPQGTCGRDGGFKATALADEARDFVLSQQV